MFLLWSIHTALYLLSSGPGMKGNTEWIDTEVSSLGQGEGEEEDGLRVWG